MIFLVLLACRAAVFLPDKGLPSEFAFLMLVFVRGLVVNPFFLAGLEIFVEDDFFDPPILLDFARLFFWLFDGLRILLLYPLDIL